MRDVYCGHLGCGDPARTFWWRIPKMQRQNAGRGYPHPGWRKATRRLFGGDAIGNGLVLGLGDGALRNHIVVFAIGSAGDDRLCLLVSNSRQLCELGFVCGIEIHLPVALQAFFHPLGGGGEIGARLFGSFLDLDGGFLAVLLDLLGIVCRLLPGCVRIIGAGGEDAGGGQNKKQNEDAHDGKWEAGESRIVASERRGIRRPARCICSGYPS